MFEWWKDLLRPIRREDEDFGQMRFLRQTTTWECRAHFAPIGREVEVLVYASEGGPSARQRGRWKELAIQYASLEASLRTELAELALSSHASDFVFELAGVAVPEESETLYEVELTFGDPSGPPQFDVRVASWKVAGIAGPL